MKRAPEGALHTTICAHSEAKKPLNRENTSAVRRQSIAGTTESEAQGVHNKHTLFLTVSCSIGKRPSPSDTESPVCCAPLFRPMSPGSGVMAGARPTVSTNTPERGKSPDRNRRASWHSTSFRYRMGQKMETCVIGTVRTESPGAGAQSGIVSKPPLPAKCLVLCRSGLLTWLGVNGQREQMSRPDATPPRMSGSSCRRPWLS